MKQNNKAMKETASLLEQAYGKPLADRVMAAAWQRFSQLCADHAGDAKAVKAHTEGDIFPCISLYAGMQQAGIPQEEALAFLDRSWSQRAEPQAASIRAMLKIPGLYRLMPRIFRWVAKNQFGEAAGFKATFYSTDSTRVKFDMTQCLYCDVCRREGCPELVPCFCHTDDVTDGRMHPRLCWNRTKIMGDGGDVCDFDLFVTDAPDTKR